MEEVEEMDKVTEVECRVGEVGEYFLVLRDVSSRDGGANDAVLGG